MIDVDLGSILEKPTNIQITIVDDICAVLDIESPINFTKLSYSDFISQHREQFLATVAEIDMWERFY